MTELTRLLQDLMSIKTTADEENNLYKIIDYIEMFFNDVDVVTRRYVSNNKPSLVITPTLGKHPKVLLSGHLDVVDGKSELFSPQVIDNRMYGRGASDMKGVVAAMLLAYKSLIKEGDANHVGMILTTDEELGGFNGTKTLVEEHDFRADVVFLPDGGRGDWAVCTDEKGIIWFEVTSTGYSAHSSKLWEGRNAISQLLGFLKDTEGRFIDEYGFATVEDNWKPTFNIGEITGGKSYNSVPDLAVAHIDIRFPSPLTTGAIEEFLQAIAQEYEYVSVKKIIDGAPTKTEKDNPYLQTWMELNQEKRNEVPEMYKTHGSSDGRFFGKYRIPIVSAKPVCSDIHVDDEWVDLKSLDEFQNITYEWLKRIA